MGKCHTSVCGVCTDKWWWVDTLLVRRQRESRAHEGLLLLTLLEQSVVLLETHQLCNTSNDSRRDGGGDMCHCKIMLLHFIRVVNHNIKLAGRLAVEVQLYIRSGSPWWFCCGCGCCGG